MSFTIKKFGQIDLRHKNWHNDPRIGCKSLSSLVDLIETHVYLKKELEEFERAFQKDKVIWSCKF
jgi:hypothetical protein